MPRKKPRADEHHGVIFEDWYEQQLAEMNVDASLAEKNPPTDLRKAKRENKK
jgi:hypothetical protein